ncbi:hypothetical protein BDA99DRAFT_5194 [Phascolomyces articulosus]|uniref:Uncharacterized protein n=1 Tax=Phascolomyces articulosus TaxID=60185 RepID=A0AAD5KCD7_9FUNG|nr:hypothetical protein BDA99DRAFT_5194 [Phascolomyces articulosus]
MGISPLGSQVEVCGTPKAAPRAIAPIGPPANGRRASSAVAGPIGSPVGLTTSRMKSGSDASADRTAIHHAAQAASSPAPAIATPCRETQYSFFSNFLFGDPPNRVAKNPCVVPPLQPEQDNKSVKGRSDTHLDRRFSNDTQEMGWTNGWTASSLLSDDFHGRLFGDVLPDRNTMILERAKVSYAKLNEMTQIVGFHTLDQLHRMMNDLYCDCPIGIQELYHVLMVRTPQNPFRCISDPRYGGIIVHHQDEPQSRSIGFDMNAFPTAVSPPTSSGTPSSNNSLGQLPLNSTHPLQQLHCNNGR